MCFVADNANLYMSLEYVCGGELFTVLRKSFRFDETRVKFYAAQITLALEYLQFMGVVYRYGDHGIPRPLCLSCGLVLFKLIMSPDRERGGKRGREREITRERVRENEGGRKVIQRENEGGR